MITDRAAKIKLVLFDVDGVLTDGKILLHADGSESKTFDIKDGTAIVWAQRLGLTVGFLSARTSLATTQRALQLGITLLHQGVRSKLETYDQIVDGLMLDGDQIAYMGDAQFDEWVATLEALKKMDFDLDLAKAQSDANPVYYVQYAHARISSIMRRATSAFTALQPAGSSPARPRCASSSIGS